MKYLVFLFLAACSTSYRYRTIETIVPIDQPAIVKIDNKYYVFPRKQYFLKRQMIETVSEF